MLRLTVREGDKYNTEAVIKKLKRVGVTVNQLDAAVVAKHAEFRNECALLTKFTNFERFALAPTLFELGFKVCENLSHSNSPL